MLLLHAASQKGSWESQVLQAGERPCPRLAGVVSGAVLSKWAPRSCPGPSGWTRGRDPPRGVQAELPGRRCACSSASGRWRAVAQAGGRAGKGALRGAGPRPRASPARAAPAGCAPLPSARALGPGDTFLHPARTVCEAGESWPLTGGEMVPSPRAGAPGTCQTVWSDPGWDAGARVGWSARLLAGGAVGQLLRNSTLDLAVRCCR